MTVGSAGGPDALRSSRVEVRWILPGALPSPVGEWFARFPSTTEAREDSYLVTPKLPGLTVKIRGDLALDVKEYLGARGILEVPGVARGRLESWRKSSFSLGARSESPDDSSSWRRVHKKRRMSAFLPDEDELVAALPIPSTRLMCTVELSELLVHDEAWWTLALESTGPTDRLEAATEETARRFLGTGIAEHVTLGVDDSAPYSDWLTDLGARG